VNVLIVEYPGYGPYKGSPAAWKLERDALFVYEYLMDKGVKAKDIMVLGRSIGSGPAAYLASKHSIGLLILMTAFTSIRGAAKDLVGPFLSRLVKQRFQNDLHVASLECPVFIIHGLEDEIIPWQHGQALYQNCNSLKVGFSFP